MRKVHTVFAFAAGLLGGIASHYLSPQPVHAEGYPTEVRARSFVLVNEQGAALGTFSEESGRPVLRLYDAKGREVWSAGGEVRVQASVLGK